MKNNLISIDPTVENLALSLIAMVVVLMIERWWAGVIDGPSRRALRLRHSRSRRRRRVTRRR